MAMLLVSCGGPANDAEQTTQVAVRPGSHNLLLDLEPCEVSQDLPRTLSVRGAQGRKVVPQEPQPITVGESEREAVLAGNGLSWCETKRAGDREERAVAVLQATAACVRGGCMSRVVLTTEDGEQHPLLNQKIPIDQGWVELRVEIPETLGPGTLRFANTSFGWLAWSELFVEHRAAQPTTRPNLVLISLDTVRSDHLSLYGYERPTSPNLDRFARHALTFRDSHSVSTWTLPSHASLFTGLLPEQHGVYSVDTPLSEHAVTVAEILRQAGYRTAAFTDGGFLAPHWGFDQGFDRYDATTGTPRAPKDAAKIFGPATRWIEQEWLASNRETPFFLFVHSYQAHEPYRVDEEGLTTAFVDPGYQGPYAQEVQASSLYPAKLQPGDLEQITALYDGGIHRLDHYLGELLDLLGREDLLETTAVLITSDHGEELMEHGGFEHGRGRVFPENIAVPLLVRPAGDSRLRSSAVPVSGLDVAPTLLAMAGLASPLPLPGSDLLALTDAPGGARSAPARRLRVAHGFSSNVTFHEERLRWEDGDWAAIVDRVHSGTQLRDRRSGERVDPNDVPAVRSRLTVGLGELVAWLEDADFAVRLPLAASVAVAPSSGLASVSVVEGWEARALEQQADGSWSTELHRSASQWLILRTEPRGTPTALEVTVTADGQSREYPIDLATALTDEQWSPLDPQPLPPGSIVHSARRVGDGGLVLSQGLTPEQKAELEALGYM